jgi:hypothetical protein
MTYCKVYGLPQEYLLMKINVLLSCAHTRKCPLCLQLHLELGTRLQVNSSGHTEM